MLHKQQHMVMTGTISRAPSQLLKGRNSEPPTPTAQVYASTWHTHTPASSLATTAPMWPQTCPTQRMNWSRRATTLCHLQDSLCCHSSAHREEMSQTTSYIRTYVRLYLHMYVRMYNVNTSKWFLSACRQWPHSGCGANIQSAHSVPFSLHCVRRL